MKFQTYEQLRLACILRKCLILVGNGTEYSYSCSHSQYTVYGAYHSSMSCLKVSSSFPPMPRQIDVWTVSNLTFVLLSFTLLHSTTEVPFIVLAIYSLRSGTLKRVNGYATRAVCRLRIDVSEELYAIPCDKRRSFAYSLDLLCSVIRFVGCTMCVASSTPMIIRCDHCLLGALWFRFHIELATCLLFGFRSSCLRPTCERHRPFENATRE